MDKATVESVMALLNPCCVTFAKWKELGKRGRTAEEEDAALREMRDAQEAFRAEVERLAAQAAPTEPPQEFESAQGRALASAWAEGWAQCRDAEYVGEEAESEAFNQSATLAQCLHADQTRFQGGLSNDELRRAWSAKLPNVIPTDEQLTAFALGIEAAAQPLKAEQAKDAAEDARMTTAARDVLAERQRQVSAEGWTPEHDDEHRSGDMARAAASYAAQAGICGSWPAGAYMASLPPLDDEERGEMMWPWNREWWKPKNPRADLVRAGALILAEIERMDRAARAAERKA